MSVRVTDDLVDHIARLARLGLEPAEREQAREHFEKVLRFVAELGTLDLEGVDPSAPPGGAHNAWREDRPRASLSPDEALANAPRRDGTAFVVPPIIEEGPEPAP